MTYKEKYDRMVTMLNLIHGAWPFRDPKELEAEAETLKAFVETIPEDMIPEL
jgi:hypothetical protein